MPVVFVVDPTAPDDLHTITLSYTFFEVEGAGGKALTMRRRSGRLRRREHQKHDPRSDR